MAKNQPAPAPDDAAETPAGPGKHRPTPTRAEREAARKRPLVPDTKEAKARARAELQRKREEARVGMAAGQERYLLPRDRGPQRRFVRDFVDAGWHLGEFLMPLMVLVIILSLVPIAELNLWAFFGLWIYILFTVFDMVLTGRRVKKKVKLKFGEDRMERGLGWYAAMRSAQMRFLRLPKPQVTRGQYPSSGGSPAAEDLPGDQRRARARARLMRLAQSGPR